MAPRLRFRVPPWLSSDLPPRPSWRPPMMPRPRRPEGRSPNLRSFCRAINDNMSQSPGPSMKGLMNEDSISSIQRTNRVILSSEEGVRFKVDVELCSWSDWSSFSALTTPDSLSQKWRTTLKKSRRCRILAAASNMSPSEW